MKFAKIELCSDSDAEKLESENLDQLFSPNSSHNRTRSQGLRGAQFPESDSIARASCLDTGLSRTPRTKFGIAHILSPRVRRSPAEWVGKGVWEPLSV